MKQTFKQFLLTESKIHVPAETLRLVMNVVASAYFSDLTRRMRIDDEEPTPEFNQALEDAKRKYGDFDLHQLSRDNPVLAATVPFRTSELPTRYRKGLNKDLAIKLTAGPMGAGNAGEYYQKTKGRAGQMRINTQLRDIDAAVYNPRKIVSHLHDLEGTVEHELQHMVQDVALQRLHPSQSGTDEMRLAAAGDDDIYYTSTEEYYPQITSAAAKFRNEIRGIKDKDDVRNRFYDAIDPRRGDGVYPFFKAIYRSQNKWKKAVKEFHRLIQDRP